MSRTHRTIKCSKLIAVANYLPVNIKKGDIIDCGATKQLVGLVMVWKPSVRFYSTVRVGTEEILELQTAYNNGNLKEVNVEERIQRGNILYDLRDKTLREAGL